MQVILLKDIKGIGRIGEVIDVSDGHARNFLIPRKLGIAASDQVVSRLEAEKKAGDKKLAETLAKAESALKSLKSKPLKFLVQADDKGHLYAGLKESEIVAKINEEGTRLIDYTPIKAVGNHKIKVNLKGNNAEVSIQVQKI